MRILFDYCLQAENLEWMFYCFFTTVQSLMQRRANEGPSYSQLLAVESKVCMQAISLPFLQFFKQPFGGASPL